MCISQHAWSCQENFLVNDCVTYLSTVHTTRITAAVTESFYALWSTAVESVALYHPQSLR